MKKMTKILMLMAVGVMAAGNVNADEAKAPAPTTVQESSKPVTWEQLVQKKYSLTDAQMKTLGDAKLSENEAVRVAHFAKLSGKSIEEILKMKGEMKGNGWGNLAKELGINPKEIGQAVAELRHERNDLRKKENDEKRRVQREKNEKEREERREKRARERQERKNEHNHGDNKGPKK